MQKKFLTFPLTDTIHNRPNKNKHCPLTTAYYKELRTTFNKECTLFYSYFSTTILLKVVVANENEINNVFLWSFKTEFRTKWAL